jgi:predicted nucleic acid-binding protein
MVVDASVIVELVLHLGGAARLQQRLARRGGRLCAPQLLDVEVLQVIRRYARTGQVPGERADLAVTLLGQLPVTRYPHEPLRNRIWALRDNLTAYDAAYVALAESLKSPLITADARLAAAPGHTATVELV